MAAFSSYTTNQWPLEWVSAYAHFLRQATAVVTQTRDLDEAFSLVLDACSAALGFLYPSIVLLDVHESRLVGRLVSSPDTRESIHRAGGKLKVPIDGILGPRRSRRSIQRLAAGQINVPADAVAYHLTMVENLVVRAFRQQSPCLASRYFDLVRPYLTEKYADLIQKALGTESFAVLPLVTGERCFGVLVVASPPGRSFGASDEAALGLFAAQTALAVENARLQRDLSDREQQVSFLLKATIDAQEEERERICMEIHDGVAQTLAPAFHYLQTLDKPELPEAVRTSVRKAGGLVRTAIREAREVIASLRPASLDTLGLVATLRYEMGELRDQANWQLEFDADQVRFPKAVETALYRVVREAVNNVTKHARATKVAIHIKQADDRIVVEIQDNGVGFDFAAVELDVHRKGVGLPSMRKRAELLSGRFYVTSRPGRGTLIHVEVPLLAHTIPDHAPVGSRHIGNSDNRAGGQRLAR
ncbi:MAG: GAF domain-containing sensor histidine kinase [Chloroflexi bacterium]|nr:GAF domain-containing sensor histidine kinase [Chloroflexota bacterium]